MRSLLLAILFAAPYLSVLATPGTREERAREAFDSGRFDEAASLYEELWAEGWVSHPLAYNLGNARENAGDSAGAFAAFLLARWISPHDTDTLANIQYLSSTHGYSAPSLPNWRRASGFLSVWQWHFLLAALIWLTVVYVVASRYNRFLRTTRPWGLPALLLLLLLACYGRVTSDLRWIDDVAVTTVENTVLRDRPHDAGKSTVSLPSGTVVTIRDRRDNWVQVQVDNSSGWIQTDTVRKLVRAGI